MKKIVFIILIQLVFSSCEKVFMRPGPDKTNKAVFEEYAKLVKEKFAMLKLKKVDIDHLRDSIGATITESTTEGELFSKLAFITKSLKDGHSTLTGDTMFYYDFTVGHPKAYDYDMLFNNYLNPAIDNGYVAEYKDAQGRPDYYVGHLSLNPEVAYIRLPSWILDITDEGIDNLFKKISTYKGLIIDLRDNGGGDPVLATKIAKYLTDKEVNIGYERFKTGPAEGDTSVSQLFLKPAASNYKFLNKPVFVLTDIWCFSATTTFMYSVYPLSNVKYLGYKTGGGAGSVASGILSNGWLWDLSVSEFIDYKGGHWDNGHQPDILQVIDENNPDVDEVLERAYREIEPLLK